MADRLERDELLAVLAASALDAAAGHGRTVHVSGEAGIGKTRLLERFGEGLAPKRVRKWSITQSRPLWIEAASAFKGKREAFAGRPINDDQTLSDLRDPHAGGEAP